MNEYYKEEVVCDALKEELKQKEVVEEYLKRLEECEETHKKMGLTEKIRKFPYIQQVFSLAIVVVMLGLLVGYMPVIIRWYTIQYRIPAEAQSALFTTSVIFNMFLFLILGLIMFFSGRVTMLWLKAGLLRKNIVAMIGENKTIRFVIPKKDDGPIWEVESKQGVQPKYEAIYGSPHKVPLMLATRKFPMGIDIFQLLKGLPMTYDMTSLFLYGEGKMQQERDSRFSGTDQLVKVMPYFIIIIAIGLIFWPFAQQQLNQNGKINSLQNEVLMYRKALADNGINPNTINPLPSSVAKITATTVKMRPSPASTGIDFKPAVK